jgi:hypothetical protein
MDPSLTLVENEDLKCWLLLDDEAIVRAAAVAAGMSDLESLVAHYSAVQKWFEAAKVKQAVGMVSAGVADHIKHMKAALGLLEKVGSATAVAQQLELDMRGNLAFYMSTGPDKKRNTARMQELTTNNSSLRVDPLSVYTSSVLPRVWALCGAHPAYWDAGKVATQDTAEEGLLFYIREGGPLITNAVKESVGARKEVIQLSYETLFLCAIFTWFRATKQTVDEHQQFLEAKWGKDGSILVDACMQHSFDRHYTIAQSIGFRFDSFMTYPYAFGVAEFCGDVHQMTTLFDKQISTLRDFTKRGSPGAEMSWYWIYAVNSFIGSELAALHPFGKAVAALQESGEGQCTDPNGCEEWFMSADWGVLRAYAGEGRSSKDGLHHMFLNPLVILGIQAVLSLSLASMDRRNFDLSWLESLPPADDPTQHDSNCAGIGHMNRRVIFAEVLEWQGRHEEAIRFDALTHPPTHSLTPPLSSLTQPLNHLL